MTAGLLRGTLCFRDVVAVHVHQGPGEQGVGTFGLGGRGRTLDSEHVFVEGDRRSVRPHAELVVQRFAEPFEAPDRLSTFPGIEMSAHEFACCLLVGGVFVGESLPQGSGAKQVQVELT
jgi:hypothetical protein